MRKVGQPNIAESAIGRSASIRSNSPVSAPASASAGACPRFRTPPALPDRLPHCVSGPPPFPCDHLDRNLFLKMVNQNLHYRLQCRHPFPPHTVHRLMRVPNPRDGDRSNRTKPVGRKDGSKRTPINNIQQSNLYASHCMPDRVNCLSAAERLTDVGRKPSGKRL